MLRRIDWKGKGKTATKGDSYLPEQLIERLQGGAGLGHETVLKHVCRFFDSPFMGSWRSFPPPLESGLCDCLTNIIWQKSHFTSFWAQNLTHWQFPLPLLEKLTWGTESPYLQEAIAACGEAMWRGTKSPASNTTQLSSQVTAEPASYVSELS